MPRQHLLHACPLISCRDDVPATFGIPSYERASARPRGGTGTNRTADAVASLAARGRNFRWPQRRRELIPVILAWWGTGTCARIGVVPLFRSSAGDGALPLVEGTGARELHSKMLQSTSDLPWDPTQQQQERGRGAQLANSQLLRRRGATRHAPRTRAGAPRRAPAAPGPVCVSSRRSRRPLLSRGPWVTGRRRSCEHFLHTS